MRMLLHTGIARAGSGRKEEVLEGVDLALEIDPLEHDELGGTEPIFTKAEVLMMFGEHEAAITQIEGY